MHQNAAKQAFFCIIILLVLTSCSSKSVSVNMKLEGRLVSFEQPPLAVRLKQDVAAIAKETSPKTVSFADKDVSPLFFQFFKTSPVNTLKYYYDLEYIAADNNLFYVGPAFFKDKEWAKVFHVDVDGYLLFGYVTLKENYFVFVYMLEGLNAIGVKTFMHYQNTRRMPEKELQFINAKFRAFRKYAEILY